MHLGTALRRVAHGEVRDRLLVPVLEDLEIVGGQVADQSAFSIRYRDGDVDQIDARLEYRLLGGRWRGWRRREKRDRQDPRPAREGSKRHRPALYTAPIGPVTPSV